MLWSLGLPLQAAPPASIRLAMIEGVPALTRAPAEIVRQAYRDVGLDIELVAMPVARALTEANAGRVDGELGRFSNIEDNAPNLRSLCARATQRSYPAADQGARNHESRWKHRKDLAQGGNGGAVSRPMTG